MSSGDLLWSSVRICVSHPRLAIMCGIPVGIFLCLLVSHGVVENLDGINYFPQSVSHRPGYHQPASPDGRGTV